MVIHGPVISPKHMAFYSSISGNHVKKKPVHLHYILRSSSVRLILPDVLPPPPLPDYSFHPAPSDGVTFVMKLRRLQEPRLPFFWAVFEHYLVPFTAICTFDIISVRIY